ncbi:MAG: hypothetical protein ABSG53_24290, partial [Thermoguttaceae bacterium]
MNEPLDAKSAEEKYTLHWPAAAGAADQASYPSLAASLAALLEHEAGCRDDGCTAPLPPWEITCHLPGRVPTSSARPRYVYHVNARAAGGGGGGEGTEESPWWGLATAVEQLTRLDQVGQIKLRAGQTVRLAHHEVFTVT